MKLINVLGVAATLTTLAVPVLYLAGLAYEQGHHSVFAVPAIARSGDFHQTLTLGFFAVQHAVEILNKWMSEQWPVMAGYGAAAGVLIALSLWGSESWIQDGRHRVRMWFRTRPNVAKASVTLGVSFFVFLTPYVVVGVLYVILTVPLLSYLVGKQVAERNLERQAITCEVAAKNSQRFHQCITAQSGETIVRGYLVATSSDYFVITENGKTRAIPTAGWEFHGTYEPSHNAGKPTE